MEGYDLYTGLTPAIGVLVIAAVVLTAALFAELLAWSPKGTRAGDRLPTTHASRCDRGEV